MNEFVIGKRVKWHDGGIGSQSSSWQFGKIHSIMRVNIKVERLRSGTYSYDPPRYIIKKKEQLKLL